MDSHEIEIEFRVLHQSQSITVKQFSANERIIQNNLGEIGLWLTNFNFFADLELFLKCTLLPLTNITCQTYEGIIVIIYQIYPP